MIIQNGSKEGKSTQELVLKEPDWVQFFLTKAKEGKIPSILRAHISKFDTVPFQEECLRCDAPATRASLYSGNARLPHYWCDDCDPYSRGALAGKLTIVRRYAEALRFVDWHCKGSREEKRILIRKLAEAKGLPGRVGKKQAEQFLR